MFKLPNCFPNFTTEDGKPCYLDMWDFSGDRHRLWWAILFLRIAAWIMGDQVAIVVRPEKQ